MGQRKVIWHRDFNIPTRHASKFPGTERNSSWFYIACDWVTIAWNLTSVSCHLYNCFVTIALNLTSVSCHFSLVIWVYFFLLFPAVSIVHSLFSLFTIVWICTCFRCSFFLPLSFWFSLILLFFLLSILSYSKWLYIVQPELVISLTFVMILTFSAVVLHSCAYARLSVGDGEVSFLKQDSAGWFASLDLGRHSSSRTCMWWSNFRVQRKEDQILSKLQGAAYWRVECVLGDWKLPYISWTPLRQW